MKTAVRTVADVDRVLAANAWALGEAQQIFYRKMSNGRHRVQQRQKGKWVRGSYHEYATLSELFWAAQVSHDNAHQRTGKDRALCPWCKTHPNQGGGA